MHVIFAYLLKKEKTKTGTLVLEPDEGSNALILMLTSFDLDQVV